MKMIILPAVVVLLLFAAGCKREVFLNDPTVTGFSGNSSEQKGLADKKDHGCLTNVGIAGTVAGTEWQVGINYTNPDIHTKKSMVITVSDNYTAANIFEKEISNIPYGSGTYNFSFPISGGGPWGVKVLSFRKPNAPKSREGWCGKDELELRLPPPCIDPSQICPSCVCPQVFDPVCGCDGVTYNNSCEAQRAGVRTWTPGPCTNR